MFNKTFIFVLNQFFDILFLENEMRHHPPSKSYDRCVRLRKLNSVNDPTELTECVSYPQFIFEDKKSRPPDDIGREAPRSIPTTT